MEYHFQKNYASAGINLIQLTVTVSVLIIMLHIKAPHKSFKKSVSSFVLTDSNDKKSVISICYKKT